VGPWQRSERLRSVTSNGSFVVGRTRRKELPDGAGSTDGESDLMREHAVVAGKSAGKLSCDESGSGVNVPWVVCDESQVGDVRALHDRGTLETSARCRVTLPYTIISLRQ
jgi:hypothetical protein